MTTANDTKVFIVNPSALIWSNDHYYLVCNNVKYENLMHLRIDRIKKVTILDTKARSFTDFTPYTIRFNSADYAKRLFNMFSGEMRSVELCCANELIENIIDRFGEKTPIVRNDENTFILRTRVALSEGLVNWIMQFGEKIKIISSRGNTINTCLSKMSLHIGKELELAHTNLVIVNLNLAQNENMAENLNFLITNTIISNGTEMIATNGNAKELLNASLNMFNSIGIKIYQLLSLNEK